MPLTRESMYEFAGRLVTQRAARRRGRDNELRLLPTDLTGQVFIKAREEAERVTGRLDWLEVQIGRLEAEIADGEQAVREACAIAWHPEKRKGDILTEWEVIPARPDPTRFQLTPEALKIRQQRVHPLRKRLEVFQLETAARWQELGDLRRIAEAAAQGEVVLIHFLSDKWRARLELGAGTLGAAAKLGGVSVYTDSFGNRLPVEALDADGRPDLPAGKPKR